MDYDRGLVPEPATDTVARKGSDPVNLWIDGWLDDCVERGLKQSTLDGYTRHAKNMVRPFIGTILIEKLEDVHLERMMKTLRERRLGPGTRHAKKVIRSTLKFAMKKKAVPYNVADLIDTPKGASTPLEDLLQTMK